MARRRQIFNRTRSWLLGLVIPLCGAVGLAVLAPIAVARADVITDVNNQLLNIIQNTSAPLIDGPPEVAREIALVDGAMYDAVNAATGSTLAPIAYTGGAVSGASANAAALQAAITVMDNLYVNPNTSLYQQYQGVKGASYFPSSVLSAHPLYATASIGPSLAQMTAVTADVASLATELTGFGGGSAIANGIALGSATGAAMLEATANDGTGGPKGAILDTITHPYTPASNAPGVYQPPATRPAMTPTWGSVTPMGMTSPALAALQATIPAPYTATAAGLTSSAYNLQVLQTECEGSRTALPANVAATCGAAGFKPESAAEAQAALFWNDPGGTLQPPGHWVQIADTVATEQGLSLLRTAQATALVGLALDDAGIGAWGIKYDYNSWRPITAIQDCNNWSPNFTTCDATWSSLIVTPPHPDYLAGHPAFSGAAATALADAIGTDNVTFTSTSVAYCNGGIATLDSVGNIIGCTLNGTFHSIAGAGCAGGGTPTHDSDGNIIGCMLDGVPESVTGGNCNNAGTVAVLNADFTADPAYNASPLICPIAETFTSISQASGGFLGAEFSRVVGGIHTPLAVQEALALGDAIGTAVAADNLAAVPEPPMAPVLGASLLALGILHHRRQSHMQVGVAARSGAIAAEPIATEPQRSVPD
jgi:hypothetical protein